MARKTEMIAVKLENPLDLEMYFNKEMESKQDVCFVNLKFIIYKNELYAFIIYKHEGVNFLNTT
ncbi:MAG: hypothetical protein ACTSR8_11935 [Promethearchaeota archaeon]